jgi:hypothetical protein
MDDEPEESPHPEAPFTPEDGAYQVIVSEYLGLRRAGASVLDASFITAAHLAVMGALSPVPPQDGQE